MSNCYSCGKEFTLKPEEIKCDNCGNVVNFPCHNCKQWFSLMNEDGIPIQVCKSCGFYPCPNCGVCGINCQKESWAVIIKEIIPTITPEQQSKLLRFIEDIKLNRDQLSCPHGVPITYAKSRIKGCIIRMMGYRIKSQVDLDKFKERAEKVMDINIGETLTVNNSREPGSYGQEWRDVFNYLVCMGKLKKTKIKREDKEYEVFERIETSSCPKLDLKDLIKKQCPNKNCKIKIYPASEIRCLCPECKYKSGTRKGQLRELKIKISNKDTCQLNRGDFKKDGESEHLGEYGEAP